MDTKTRTMLACALMLAWGALAFTGQTPVDQFVQALRDILISLGVFHATLTSPGK